MVSWAHPSPQQKWQIDRFSRFSAAHGCDQRTDKHTDHETSATGRIFAPRACDVAANNAVKLVAYQT